MHLNELHVKLDDLWSEFWPATELRPLAVVDFINCIVLIRQLDVTQSKNERDLVFNEKHLEKPIYSIDQEELQWNSFQHLDKGSLYLRFNKENGILDFVKNTEAYKRLRKFDNEGELKPIPELLAKTVAMVSEQDLSETNIAWMNDYLLSKADLASKNRDLELAESSLKATSKTNVNATRKLSSVYVLLFIIFLGGLAATVFYFQSKKPDATILNQESEQAAIKDNKNDSLLILATEKKPVKKKGAAKKTIKSAKKQAAKKDKPGVIPVDRNNNVDTANEKKTTVDTTIQQEL